MSTETVDDRVGDDTSTACSAEGVVILAGMLDACLGVVRVLEVNISIQLTAQVNVSTLTETRICIPDQTFDIGHILACLGHT